MSQQCPDCRNEFVQPFVCTTCGAQRLYDATVTSAYDEIKRLRAERDALAKDNAALRALLAECIPHVNGNTGEWRILRKRGFLSPEAYVIANERINSGDALLDRIVAAVQR